MDSNSRRLTRSTYIGEPTTALNRKARSSSTDSENGWIPPPPLLSLGTKFLITNPQHRSHLSCSLSPVNTTDPISTGIAIAHLKCQPSNSSHHPEIHPDVTAGFRLLEDHELIEQPLSMDPSDSNQQDDSSEFIQAENKAFSRRHRQFEMIEKRSKKLEKEKLLHERFKLKNRLDILMKGSGADWKSVRTLTLKRIKEDELKQRSIGNSQGSSDHPHLRETEFDKVERMRHIMIKETEEILKRYDKLLDPRKPSKPKTGRQPSEAKPLTLTPTPSNPQLKPFKHRLTPRSFKQKQANLTSSDPDHSYKSTKRNHHQPISKLNLLESVELPECDASLNHTKKRIGPKPTHGRQSASNSILVIPENSPDSQVTKSVRVEDEQSPTPRPIPLPTRESLYDSASIRRSAMDEQLLNGKKRVGRSTYALGCKLPDLNEIQLDYLAQIQSMVPEKQDPSRANPFDRPERQIQHVPHSTSPTVNLVMERDDTRVTEHWIEFNPTVNEEKEIICHQGEFGYQSKFFELDSELDYLEERKMVELIENHKSIDDHGLPHRTTVAFSSRLLSGGKSIRKLIEERIQSWEN